jgi:predicted  nucleic acid-binding Zn-ribbon protein
MRNHQKASLNTKMSEIESRNFALEEQAKDFKIQLTSRQMEIAKTQEALQKQKAEYDKLSGVHEERLKKIKCTFIGEGDNEQRCLRLPTRL